jgi:transposase
MPNLIRRNRGYHPPPLIRYPILRDPGTRERDIAYSLKHDANWTDERIASSLGISRQTISNSIHKDTWTPQKQKGRKPKIDTPTHNRLVARAQRDRWHRQRSFEEIALLEGVTSCKQSLYKAFEKEGYFHRVATEKPLITPAQREARLKWAYSHLEWTPEMWAAVVWTDKASIRTDGGQIFVTRSAEEKYDIDCCIPKFRGYSSWMIHGSISHGNKGPLVVFEKDWAAELGY